MSSESVIPDYHYFKLKTTPLPYLENVAVSSLREEREVLPDASLLDPDLIDFDPSSSLVTTVSRKRRKGDVEIDELLPSEKVPRLVDDDANHMALPVFDDQGNLSYVQKPSSSVISTPLESSKSLLKEARQQEKDQKEREREDLDPNDPVYVQRKSRQGKQVLTHLLQSSLSREEGNISNIAELVNLCGETPHASVAMGQNSKNLFKYSVNPSSSVALELRLAAIPATCTVLCHNLPDIRIRELTEKERNVDSLSREVKQERQNNDILLKSYSKYLSIIETLLNSKSDAANYELLTSAINSAGNLLTSRPEFNYSNRLVSILVRAATLFLPRSHQSKMIELRQSASSSLAGIIRDDSLGQLAIHIAAQTNKIAKSNLAHLSAELLSIFENLQLRQDDITDSAMRAPSEEKALLTAKMRRKKEKEIKKLPKHLKKARKEQSEVEKELNKSEQSKSKTHRQVIKSQILQSIMAIYLRIVRFEDESVDHLRAIALRGVAHYADFLSVDILIAILDHLKSLISNPSTPLETALHASTVVVVSLKGPAEAINFEFSDFHSSLYLRLLDLMKPNNYSHTELFIRILSEILNQRKMSLSRAAAFFKRLFSLACFLPPQYAIMTLVQAKKILLLYPSLSGLLSNDSEDRNLSAIFLPTVSNPDHANALNSSVYEVSLLSTSFHPYVTSLIELFSNQKSTVTPKLIDSDLIFDPPLNWSKVKSKKVEKSLEVPEIIEEDHSGELKVEFFDCMDEIKKFIK
ncbi:hypothetical protein RCL1_003251 [Eukaryota sp. TZLM3-RCL]